MRHTPEETAVLVALMLHRFAQTRMRMSEKTLRILSRRSKIRKAFLQQVTEELEDLGLNLYELERGGYGVLRASVLEGAPLALSKKYLREDLKMAKKDPKHFAKLRLEVDAAFVEEAEPDDE